MPVLRQRHLHRARRALTPKCWPRPLPSLPWGPRYHKRKLPSISPLLPLLRQVFVFNSCLFDDFRKAFSQALATACVEGEGFGLAVQTSLAEAIIEPIATVSVYLASGVDCRDRKNFDLLYVKHEIM